MGSGVQNDPLRISFVFKERGLGYSKRRGTTAAARLWGGTWRQARAGGRQEMEMDRYLGVLGHGLG